MINFYTTLKNIGGRNNSGSITVRHRGRYLGVRRSVNYFNFKRFNFSDFVECSPNTLSKVFTNFRNGVFNFIFSKHGISQPLRLFEFRPGSYVSNIEAFPGSGPKYVRSPYSRAIVIRRLGTNSVVKLSSGEIRKFKTKCSAFPSQTDSFVKYKKHLGTAGASRRSGRRPSVRGCAMNPVDHPHGGRTGESRPSVSPWGQLTKGFRTRFKLKNEKIVIVSVQELKNKKQIQRRSK